MARLSPNTKSYCQGTLSDPLIRRLGNQGRDMYMKVPEDILSPVLVDT